MMSVFFFPQNRSEITNTHKWTTLVLKLEKRWQHNHAANRLLQLHRHWSAGDINHLKAAVLCVWCSIAALLLVCVCAYLHSYQSCVWARQILPSVQSPRRLCLPEGLRGSAGPVEVLPPNSHQGCSLLTLTPRPGCPLRRQRQRAHSRGSKSVYCACCVCQELLFTTYNVFREIHISICCNTKFSLFWYQREIRVSVWFMHIFYLLLKVTCICNIAFPILFPLVLFWGTSLQTVAMLLIFWLWWDLLWFLYPWEISNLLSPLCWRPFVHTVSSWHHDNLHLAFCVSTLRPTPCAWRILHSDSSALLKHSY